MIEDGRNIRSIYFIGICGTAMGSVAAMLRQRGYDISGSDQDVYPPMSVFLRDKGIDIRHGYSARNLDPHPDLVVVGNAISRGNPEIEEVLDRKIPYLSLPETLKFFFLRSSHNLVVTGTHGKTTTTSLLAWVFERAGKEPGFMIGGIPLNFGQGCWLGGGKFWVLEGDEYDTAFFDKRSKFLHYLPELVIINNIEFDHADIFDSLEQIKTSFARLVNLTPRNGMIIVNADDANAVETARNAHAQLLEVGFSENAASRISGVRAVPEGAEFQLLGQTFRVPLFGNHNVQNAAMTVMAAHLYGIPFDVIRDAFRSFKGIKRRMETRGIVRGVTVMDDFAHHPTAIAETLVAIRSRHSKGRILVAFEPRSNTTRRAVFQNTLPPALAKANRVFIGAVARADRLEPANRLDPEKVARDTTALGAPAAYIPDTALLAETLCAEAREGDMICVLTNGGFDGLVERLLRGLENPLMQK